MTRILLFLRQLSWTSTLSAVSAVLAVLITLITAFTISATTIPATTAVGGPFGNVALTLALVSISLAILSGRE